MARLKLPPEAFNNDQLQAAMAAVWEKSLPLLRQRVDVLETAVATLEAGTLNKELRDQATHEAHRLAGLLGTFGYPEGTDAARVLELAFDAHQAEAMHTQPGSADFAASLMSAVQVLRTIVGE
jgi:HPt (histidine-containing phosphotransfer) domain-containing protein